MNTGRRTPIEVRERGIPKNQEDTPTSGRRTTKRMEVNENHEKIQDTDEVTPVALENTRERRGERMTRLHAGRE